MVNRLYTEIPGLRETLVWICSRIGERIDRPQMVSVQIRLEPSVSGSQVTDTIRYLVTEEIARIPAFCMELAEGRYSIC